MIIFFKENYIHNITLLNLLKRNYTFFSPMINGCWVWHNLRKLLKTFLFVAVVVLLACFSRICMKFLFTLESLLILSRYVSFTHNSVAVFHSLPPHIMLHYVITLNIQNLFILQSHSQICVFILSRFPFKWFTIAEHKMTR